MEVTEELIEEYKKKHKHLYDDWFVYKDQHMPLWYLLKCEEDERYYKCILRDGFKKITRAHRHFDRFDLEDGIIRLVSKYDSDYVLEGKLFIGGLDSEPFLEVTLDTMGYYVSKGGE